MARPGVGDAQQVQGGLHPAVLPAGPVEAQEHHVRHAAQIQHPGPKLAGSALCPGRLHRLQIRGLPPDPGKLLRDGGGEQGGGLLPGAQVHIDQGRLVPPLPQGGAHLAAAGEGHIALRAEAPGQNNDFHNGSPYSTRYSTSILCWKENYTTTPRRKQVGDLILPRTPAAPAA